MADLLPQNAAAIKAEAIASPIHVVARHLAGSFAVYGSANFGIRALNLILIADRKSVV